MKVHRLRGLTHLGVALLVLAGSFCFYVFSGPADVAWMEGAQHQRRVALAEIGEGPWDKPLYVLLTQPFLLLPWATLPRRVGLASAVFASATCLLVFLLMKVLLEVAPQFIARRVGILAAISIGVAHTFWLRTVTPGPEVLDALLLSAILYSLVRFANEGKIRYLYAANLLLGLSLSNNLMMVFLLPFFALWMRIVRPPLVRDIGVTRLKGLLVFVAGAALGLIVAAWGWSSAGYEIPPEQLSWVTEWRDHIRLAWDEPLQRSLIRFGALFFYNFPPWTAIIGLIGLVELFRRQKYVFWLIVPLGLLHSFLAVSLILADPVPTYLTSWVLFSVAVGYGWWKVLSDSSWRGFIIALLLSLSPILVYRFATDMVERLGEQVRVRSFLGLPFETPVDSLDDFLNPHRRQRPDSRAFAVETLSLVPEGARVGVASRTGELVFAPARYLLDVEHPKSGISYEIIGADDQEVLLQWAAEDTPLYLVGLHPPNPAVEALLDRYRLAPVGYLFRVEPREPAAEYRAADVAGSVPIAGEWSGFVRPQGFTVDFSIREAPDGTLSGRVILNRDGASPREGRFTRISLIGESVLGRVTYNELIHVHIDASQTGAQLEGAWQVFEVPTLTGRFVVWKKPASPE